MSDFPYVGPPPGGLTSAMATARRRRLRSAGTTSGLSAMTLLLVALLVGQTGRTTLVQGPTKETPAVTTDRSVTTDRHAPVSGDVAGTASVALGTAPTATAPRTGAVAPVVPGGTVAAGPTTRQQSTAVSPRTPYAAGPIARSDNTFAITQCAIGGDGKSTTVCPELSYSDVGPASAPHRLSADVCSSDPNPVLLHYPDTAEVDFTVLDPKGREVWRWSRWHPAGPTAHVLTLQTGFCFYWTFDWTGVDASGAALPKGDGYRLKVRFHAEELAHRVVADYPFALT